MDLQYFKTILKISGKTDEEADEEWSKLSKDAFIESLDKMVKENRLSEEQVQKIEEAFNVAAESLDPFASLYDVLNESQREYFQDTLAEITIILLQKLLTDLQSKMNSEQKQVLKAFEISKPTISR